MDIKGKQRGASDATASDGRRREEISRKQIGKEKYEGWEQMRCKIVPADSDSKVKLTRG